MRQRSFTRQHVVFLVVAVALMLLIDRFLSPPVVEETKTVTIEHVEDIPAVTETPKPDFAPPLEFSVLAPMMTAEKAEIPAWKRHAIPVSVESGKPRVVIIIDDMGMDRVHTREAMDLPGPLTFAFLPYAGNLKAQTEMAKAKGHELMVHVPMEPMKGGLNAGPHVLKTGTSPADFLKTLNDDLAAFDGYVGINNHMGSRMTQDRAGMQLLMADLKKRGLLFVDSKTISTSVAEEEAQKAGIPYAGRDVFLDHEETYEAVEGALEDLEKAALKDGLAIAIGHPKAETLKALREWLPTLQAKGIVLVPVSAAVTVPSPLSSPAPTGDPEE
ncbi:MAG: divergent polysaccharide deacetylase family protein [Micavibrio sp.]